jgi:hypothetical protein
MLRRYSHAKVQWSAVAALALVMGAGLFSAAPARADHDGPRAGFNFFFGFPVPPPPPPPVYYYEPAPRIVVQERPYYRDWRYRERDRQYWEWRERGRHERHRYHHDDRDYRDYRDRD